MQLDRVLDSPLLAATTAELAGAHRVQYVLHQTLRYDYDQPIRDLRHRLVVVPPVQHGEQFRRAHRLRIDGAQGVRRSARDSAGNAVTTFRAAHVERGLEVHLLALVERVGGHRPTLLAHPARHDPRWCQPTRLTRPSLQLHALGYAATAGLSDPRERALALSHATHEAMRYGHDLTGISTTAAEALTIGSGVCQDFAHVMLAMCHAVHLPARYVSGHLIGQGGTHAWVEVLLAHRDGTELLAVDPCNDRLADRRYITVATGRDYRSVAPTSGRFRGAAAGRLTCSRRVGVLSAA